MGKQKLKGSHCNLSDGHRKCETCGTKTCEEENCPRELPVAMLSEGFRYFWQKKRPNSWYENRKGMEPRKPRVVIGPVFCNALCEVKWRLKDPRLVGGYTKMSR